MIKTLTHFECQTCGASYPKWTGKCTTCNSWNNLIEIKEEKTAQKIAKPKRNAKPISINHILFTENETVSTGINEFDMVLGKGISKGSVILLGGEPGVGKSTLSLQVSQSMAQKGLKVLYIAAEESESQVKGRAERCGPLPETLWVYTQTNIKKVIIFDVFEGNKLSINKKSIALKVILQPLEKTFTDSEIEKISTNIIDLVPNSFEGELRQ